ncbi:hypothetical protein ACFQJ5_07925 [Halomicroarcula sp. GCM10025324]|uniref:hypothetical protein n=1 Tax=Haloarcula TaxID=2237 RepID=UPI0023E800F8|nr:hypothetical protein [Halomicroarcula sp. ZS-22-S1]
MSQPVQSGEPITTAAELLDRLERRPDLAIDCDLDVTIDGTTVNVLGYEDLVAVDCPSVRSAVDLARRHRTESMDAAAALASTGLTAELRVRGVPLARVGDGARPSRLAQWLGLGPVELVPEGALLAAVTRRRG